MFVYPSLNYQASCEFQEHQDNILHYDNKINHKAIKHARFIWNEGTDLNAQLNSKWSVAQALYHHQNWRIKEKTQNTNLGRVVCDFPRPNPEKIGVFDGLKVVGSEIDGRRVVGSLRLCLDGGETE